MSTIFKKIGRQVSGLRIVREMMEIRSFLSKSLRTGFDF